VSLPKTSYLWAVLLIAALIIGGRREKKPEGQRTPALTGTGFSDTLTAEQQARLGMSSLISGASVRPLDDAYRIYVRLARTRPVPAPTRRALIVGAAAKKPLDPWLLDDLRADLRALETPPEQIDTEVRLWRALYGSGARIEPGDEDRIRTMDLGFFGEWAVADLKEKLGHKAEAAALREKVSAEATRATLKFAALALLMALAGLTGVALLVLFTIAATTRRWELVGRVATRPQRIPPALLVDAFLFYLMLYKLGSLGLGALLRALKATTPIPWLLGLQVVSGIAAIFYTRWRARQSGVSLGELGLTRERLGSDLLYGVAGWCAALPLVFVFGFLSQKLFHGSGATPNPVLPLLAAERTPLSRALIFAMAALGAPIFEELFFRGVLFSAFRRVGPWGLAVALSGAIFALVHPMQDWLPILVLGVAFGTLRELRQSLVPGIVAHFLQNAFAFLMLTSLLG
jgi:membrane protease YdiL (CAAX protease family)